MAWLITIITEPANGTFSGKLHIITTYFSKELPNNVKPQHKGVQLLICVFIVEFDISFHLYSLLNTRHVNSDTHFLKRFIHVVWRSCHSAVESLKFYVPQDLRINRVKSPSFGQAPNIGDCCFSGSKGSTEVVATGPNNSYQTNFSAVVDWRLKQQCCFTVRVCVSANSDVIFSPAELRFRSSAWVLTCTLFISTQSYTLKHVYHVFPSLRKAQIPRYAAMFRLVGAIISLLDIIHRPVFILKNNVSKTGFCLRNVVFLNKDWTMDNVQKTNNCINMPSSQTFRSYLD
jgi:hypothetical protein